MIIVRQKQFGILSSLGLLPQGIKRDGSAELTSRQENLLINRPIKNPSSHLEGQRYLEEQFKTNNTLSAARDIKAGKKFWLLSKKGKQKVLDVAKKKFG